MLTIRPATAADARHVGERMRQGDALECAMFGFDPVKAIEASMAYCVIPAECLVADGEPVAVFGLRTDDITSGVGNLWILTAESIEQHRIGYARFARKQIERAFGVVNRIENFVDVRYTRAIALLEWLGFTVEPDVRDGLRLFWMEKK